MFSVNIGSSASAFKEARESVDIFSPPADNWRPRRQEHPDPLLPPPRVRVCYLD